MMGCRVQHVHVHARKMGVLGLQSYPKVCSHADATRSQNAPGLQGKSVVERSWPSWLPVP